MPPWRSLQPPQAVVAPWGLEAAASAGASAAHDPDVRGRQDCRRLSVGGAGTRPCSMFIFRRGKSLFNLPGHRAESTIPPYTRKQGETLPQLAKRFKLPP
jgi:hypothetical protein